MVVELQSFPLPIPYKFINLQYSLLLIANSGNLFLMKLRTFFFEDVEQGLGTFQNLVESAPSFLDGLVVLVTCAVLFGEGLVDDLKPISKRLHLLLNLPLFFLLLVDQVLNFCALLFNALHHFRQFHIGVIEIP